MQRMKKKIPWWMPSFGRAEIKFINMAFRKNYLNEGELTSLFEKKISSLLGSKFALALTNGTSAIFLSLKALGIGPGDEVIVPDVTFIATANAVEMCGARPVLVDIDPATMNISCASFASAITSRTKAVIPVHVSGRPADMETIAAIAAKNNIFVVEDAAEALMSKHKGRYLGTFGKTGCFSFSANKTISTGQGGMIVTDDAKIYSRLKELKDQGRPFRGTGGDDLHNSIGYNFKFTDLQAAVGLGQLADLKRRTARMRRNYQLYAESLANLKEAALFSFNIAAGELPQWTDGLFKQRPALDRYLASKNIDCRRYWFPIHQQRPYLLPDERFANSTRLSPSALWLPSAFTMTDKEIGLVAGQIKDFYAKNSRSN